MSRLREELDLIPRPALLIAAIVYTGVVALLLKVLGFGYLLGFCLPLLPLTFVLLTGYVYADAKRRGMRYVMWTLLALLIPNAIGFILYFILREPRLVECPQCGGSVRSQFPFCPQCGASRARSCPQCRGAVESHWLHCPHCGTSLKPAGVMRENGRSL